MRAPSRLAHLAKGVYNQRLFWQIVARHAVRVAKLCKT
jgi:hypothetical protein